MISGRMAEHGGKARRQLTDSFEVLYVHAMVRFEVAQRVSKETRRLEKREERCGLTSIFQLLSTITWSDSFVWPCLFCG